MSLRARWAGLLLATAACWATLPAGPALGRAVLDTAAGAWLLGPGLGILAACAGAALALGARRRGAGSARAWGLLAVAVAAWIVALDDVPQRPVERVHLVEYGLFGWLSWRALAPLAGEPLVWPLAALLGGAIGWAEELVQAVTPGRYYDPRDVLTDALGVALGLLTLAVLRTTRSPEHSLPAGPDAW